MLGSFTRRVGAYLTALCIFDSCGQAPAGDPNAPGTTGVAPRALAVGDPAPEWSLPGTDGKQYTLADYRGRQAVVLAWFAKAFTEG